MLGYAFSKFAITVFGLDVQVHHVMVVLALVLADTAAGEPSITVPSIAVTASAAPASATTERVFFMYSFPFFLSCVFLLSRCLVPSPSPLARSRTSNGSPACHLGDRKGTRLNSS